MQPFLDENSFKAREDGTFANDTKVVSVQYDEPRQMYTLSVADIDEGNVGDFSEIDAWLFDDTQIAKDAASVGIDFVRTLRKNMGIKLKRAVAGAEIDLPSANKSGSMTVMGFSKKVLDVFPTLKEEYKNFIATHGDFLYLNFFGEYLVPQLKSLLASGNKKQVKKVYDLLDDAYVKGDRETVNLVVAILCAASYNDSAVHTAVKEMLTEDKHFSSAFEAFLPVFTKNKKLVSTLIK